MTTPTFSIDTDREQMLEALRTVLATIPGVRTVDRQAITSEMLAATQLPAIRIEEAGTRYVWAHRQQPRLTADVLSNVVLDLQLIVPVERKGPGQRESTWREAFAHAVLATLAANPTLYCQLPGEPVAVDHAQDVGAHPELASVRYLATAGPEGRALISLVVRQEVALAREPTGRWLTVIAELRALDEVGVEDSYEPPPFTSP